MDTGDEPSPAVQNNDAYDQPYDNSSRAEYKRRLERLYQAHNPGKVAMVDEFLNRYVGREDTLYRKICQQYKAYGVVAEPPPEGYVEEYQAEAVVTSTKGVLVRAGPASNSQKVRTIADKTKLNIIERSGNRLHIQTVNGVDGWISEISSKSQQLVKVMKRIS